MKDMRELHLHFFYNPAVCKSIDLINDYNILDPYICMVEQQKIDIEEESTTTARGIKKETKDQRQELSRAEETQDNAAGVETKDLNE